MESVLEKVHESLDLPGSYGTCLNCGETNFILGAVEIRHAYCSSCGQNQVFSKVETLKRVVGEV